MPIDIDEALLIASHARARVRGPFVYFFSSGEYIKIGWTANVSMRLSTCQSGNPLPISLEAVALGGKPEEEILHRHFLHHNFRAEWFHAVPALKKLINRLAGYGPWEARAKLGEWFYRETGSSALDHPEQSAGARKLRAEDVE